MEIIKRDGSFSKLVKLNVKLSGSGNINDIFQVLAEDVLGLIPSACLSLIYEADSEKKCLHLAGRCYPENPEIEILNKRKSHISFDSITGDFIRNNKDQCFTVVDIVNNERFYWTDLRDQLMLKSMMIIKIEDRNKEVIGVINLYFRQELSSVQIDDEDKFLINDMIFFISTMINNLKSDLILDGFRKIENCIRKDPFSYINQSRIIRIAKMKIGASMCSIFLKNNFDQFELSGSTDKDFFRLNKGKFYNVNEGVTGWVGRYGKTVRIIDALNQEEYHNYDKDMNPSRKLIENKSKCNHENRSFLVIPIKSDENIIGVLRFTTEPNDKPFTPADQYIIESMIDLTAKELEKEKNTVYSFRTLAHQLIAPISAIGRNCREMRDGLISVERRNDLNKTNINCCELAFSIVTNFATIQRIASGQPIGMTNPRSIRILNVLKRSSALVATQSRYSSINVKIDRDTEISAMPGVVADDDLLQQVFLNLLDNAVKYSVPNEEIRIYLYEFNMDGFFKIAIESYGIPILEEEKEKIFLQGYRSQMVSNLGKPGLGIGLPVAKAIVEGHGGSIQVISNLQENGIAQNIFIVGLPFSHK
ncbi:ATP-binding protein [Armatimonas sp.]|uniref:GAF domain-containing sensor histidine kinase n=1 Tax=Armatimonas sp. TaxID=1872638 RepID=UPI00374CC04A